MKINYNVSAMLANNSLKTNDKKLTDSLGRLSSGYKINRAKDNAAGLAISRRMNAQIRGLREANQDAKDGASVVEIADGALAECHDILQRINELCVKSANGTMTDNDRGAIQSEIEQLSQELVRIGKTTEYNGQTLMDGTFDLKGYVENNNNVKVKYYSDAVKFSDYKMEITDTGSDTYSIKMTDKSDSKERTLSGKLVDGQLIATGEDGYEVRLELRDGWKSQMDLDVELKGYGAMTLQIGANEGQTLDMRFPELSLLNMGLGNTEGKLTLVAGPSGTPDPTIDYAQKAGEAIQRVSKAIDFISQMRSRLGAYQNRLEHTENNLSVSEENVTAAYSRIMDTDMAEEMSKYSNLNIVSQAATAILAQANERPSQMLQLLQ
ncbi:MAG: flagellin [Lachnospiraceae bacterium]|nr:flagellin [Lachnospiraceae bacterium]